MTDKFGIEIEFYGLGRDTRHVARQLTIPDILIRGESYNHELRHHWKVVTDGSVLDGAELVSPPLVFNDASLDEVRKIFAKLKEQECFVRDNCGFHVHVDGTFLRSYSETKRNDFFRFLVAAYQANESVFDRLVKSHRNTNSYCKSTKDKSWDDLMNDRYHKLNLNSFIRHGTIEFRHFHGTINGDAAIAWITLCVTFMRNVRARFEASYERAVNRSASV